MRILDELGVQHSELLPVKVAGVETHAIVAIIRHDPGSTFLGSRDVELRVFVGDDGTVVWVDRGHVVAAP